MHPCNNLVEEISAKTTHEELQRCKDKLKLKEEQLEELAEWNDEQAERAAKYKRKYEALLESLPGLPTETLDQLKREVKNEKAKRSRTDQCLK